MTAQAARRLPEPSVDDTYVYVRDPKSIKRAKAYNARQRRHIFKVTGLRLDADGRPMREAA